MAKLLLFCAVFSVLCCLISGNCQFYPMPPGSESCTIDETSSSFSLNLPGNSYAVLNYPNCQNCTCSNTEWGFALSCCGIGHHAGVFRIQRCRVVQRPGSCYSVFVDADDPSQPCRHISE